MRGAALTKRCSIHRTQQGFWCPAVPLRWVYTPSTPLETHHSFHALLARSLATIFETGTSIWNVGKRIPIDGNDSARGKTENEKKTSSRVAGAGCRLSCHNADSMPQCEW